MNKNKPALIGKGNSDYIRKLVGLGLLTAIVVVLQLLGSFIRFGTFSISLVLMPIVVGAALYGVWAGGWLGLAFGVIVLLSGDAALFMGLDPVGAVLTVLIKGAAAGILAALVYKLIARKGNRYLAVVAAAAVCPIVNTGIFLIGCRLFFFSTVREWAAASGYGANAFAYMILGLVGLNFVFEFIINLILSPTIVKLIDVGERRIRSKNASDTEYESTVMIIVSLMILAVGAACLVIGFVKIASFTAEAALVEGAKRPGTLYVIFGAISAIAGAALFAFSLAKRLRLSKRK